MVIDDLPLAAVHESVRVTGRGPGSIVGIDVSTARRARRDSGRVAELLAERDRLTLSQGELADGRRAVALRVTPP